MWFYDDPDTFFISLVMFNAALLCLIVVVAYETSTSKKRIGYIRFDNCTKSGKGIAIDNDAALAKLAELTAQRLDEGRLSEHDVNLVRMRLMKNGQEFFANVDHIIVTGSHARPLVSFMKTYHDWAKEKKWSYTDTNGLLNLSGDRR